MEAGSEPRVALITGASGGIGLATAARLAEEGCRLVLHAHRAGREFEEKVESLAPADRTLVVRGDVSRAEDVAAIVGEGEKRFGGIDACVIAAGVWPPDDAPLDRLPTERIRNVLDVNLLGAMLTSREFLGQVRRTGRRGTSLVLVGSTAGSFGEAGHAEYAVSKAGLRGLLLSYKNEVVRIDPGGRVNLVEPGWTDTPMARPTLADDAAVRKAVSTMALRRIARPEDIAESIAFFCCPRRAAHLTGQTLVVAGGMEGRRIWEEKDLEPETIRPG